MDNPLVYLLLGLLVAWVLSYFYSYMHNQRKLKNVAAWLQTSIHILGTKVSSRWYGTDRMDVTVAEGRGNIFEAAVVLGVQSRQLFRALLSILRGGRDSISILATLRKPTARGMEFEIYETKGPVPATVATAEKSSQPWQIVAHPKAAAYQIAYRTPGAKEMAIRTLTLLLDDKFDLRRFSVRSSSPHIFVIVNSGMLPPSDAANLLQLVRTISDEVATLPEKELGRSPKSPKNQPKNENKSLARLEKPRSAIERQRRVSILPRQGATPLEGVDKLIMEYPRIRTGDDKKADLN
jgi:hypothetical protein